MFNFRTKCKPETVLCGHGEANHNEDGYATFTEAFEVCYSVCTIYLESSFK